MELTKYNTAQEALTALVEYLGDRFEKECEKSHTKYFLDGLRIANDRGTMCEEYILRCKGDKWVIEEE